MSCQCRNEDHFWLYAMVFVILMHSCGAPTRKSIRNDVTEAVKANCAAPQLERAK